LKGQLFELGNAKRIQLKINVKKILAVINATYAVAKRKHEKIRLAGKPDFFSYIYIFIISEFS